ncbi:MAG: DUF4381 domain-containing protein [Pseudomonas sp.]|nr:DUF4381 domain-containing protein [Pseudomonas sp.]
MYGGAAFADKSAPTQRPDIEQLREMALPPAISYTPQTWGWAAVAVLLIIALIAYAAWRLWQWRQNQYRRDALLRLAQIERAGDTGALRELPELLKRVALSMPGNPAVATLQGEAWQQFLQAHSKQPLPADFSQQLAQLAYAPLPPDLATRQLLQHSRQWVEGHHVAT